MTRDVWADGWAAGVRDALAAVQLQAEPWHPRLAAAVDHAAGQVRRALLELPPADAVRVVQVARRRAGRGHSDPQHQHDGAGGWADPADVVDAAHERSQPPGQRP